MNSLFSLLLRALPVSGLFLLFSKNFKKKFLDLALFSSDLLDLLLIFLIYALISRSTICFEKNDFDSQEVDDLAIILGSKSEEVVSSIRYPEIGGVIPDWIFSPWLEGLALDEIDTSRVPVWIQIHGVSMVFMSVHNAIRMSSKAIGKMSIDCVVSRDRAFEGDSGIVFKLSWNVAVELVYDGVDCADFGLYGVDCADFDSYGVDCDDFGSYGVDCDDFGSYGVLFLENLTDYQLPMPRMTNSLNMITSTFEFDNLPLKRKFRENNKVDSVEDEKTWKSALKIGKTIVWNNKMMAAGVVSGKNRKEWRNDVDNGYSPERGCIPTFSLGDYLASCKSKEAFDKKRNVKCSFLYKKVYKEVEYEAEGSSDCPVTVTQPP